MQIIQPLPHSTLNIQSLRRLLALSENELLLLDISWEDFFSKLDTLDALESLDKYFYALVLRDYFFSRTDSLTQNLAKFHQLFREDSLSPALKFFLKISDLRLKNRLRSIDLAEVEFFQNSLVDIPAESPLIMAEACFVIGQSFEILSKFDSAREAFQKASREYESGELLAKSCRAKLNALANLSCLHTDAALVPEYMALAEFALLHGEKSVAGVCYHNISREYQREDLFDAALKYSEMALSVFRTSKSTLHGAMVMAHHAHLLVSLSRFTEASQILEELKILNFPEVIATLKILELSLLEAKKKLHSSSELKMLDMANSLPTWKERFLELIDKLSGRQTENLEDQLIDLLQKESLDKFDLVERLYGSQNSFFMFENRLKNLLNRVRKKYPKRLEFKDNKYSLSKSKKGTAFTALCFLVATLGAASTIHAGERLLKFSSVFTDQSNSRKVKMEGSGFLIQIPNGGRRLFAVTSSHVSSGAELIIEDASQKRCEVISSLVDDQNDLGIYEVRNCNDARTFDFYPVLGFYSWVVPSDYPAGIFGPNKEKVLLLSSDRMFYGQEIVTLWNNIVGDVVSNLEVFAGQSGSPLIQVLSKNEMLPMGPLEYNVKLKGIGKGSWRFFRLSKAISPAQLEHNLMSYLAGKTGNISNVKWVLRSGHLNQEQGNDTRDLSLKLAPNGNGISIDGSNSDSLASTAAANIRSDLELYKNSGIALGMIFKGQSIIAWEVQFLQEPEQPRRFVYASMSNLVYLQTNTHQFKILKTLGQDADLRPVLAQRLNLKLEQLYLKHFLNFVNMGLNIREPIRAKMLFRVEDDSNRIWGWDYRTLFFLDFEEIQSKGSVSLIENIRQQWISPYTKVFGILKRTSAIVASVKEIEN